jgi:hypothetical protein
LQKTNIKFNNLIIILSSILFFASFALLVPKGSGPDESYHLTAIWCSSDKVAGHCENLEIGQGSNNVRFDVPEVLFEGENCHVSSNSDLTSINRCVSAQNVSQLAMLNSYHIPYLSSGLLYKILGSMMVLDDVRSNLMLIKFFPILILLILLIGLNIINKNMLLPALAMTLIIYNPQVLFLFGTFNPSLYAIIGATFFPFFYRELFRLKTKRQQIIVYVNLVITTILLIGSRTDSMLLILVFLLLNLTLNFKEFNQVGKNSKVFVIILTSIVFLNLLYSLSKFSFSNLNGQASNSFFETYFDWISLNYIFNLPGLWLGMFGYEGTGGVIGLGWSTIPIPIIIPFIQIILIVLIFAHFFVIISYRNRIMILILLFLFFIVIPSLPMTPMNISTTGYYQPRYILPAFCLIISLLISSDKTGEKKFNWSAILYLSFFSTLIFIYTFQLRISRGLDIYSDWYVNMLTNINTKMWPRANPWNYDWNKINEFDLQYYLSANKFTLVLLVFFSLYLSLILGLKKPIDNRNTWNKQIQ